MKFFRAWDILNVALIYDSRTNEVLDTGKVRSVWPHLTPFDLCSVKLDSTPTSIEFSPNSERIAIGTIRGKVIVYDMVGKKMTIQRQVQGSTDSVRIVTTFRPWFISVRPESPLKGSHKCCFMRYFWPRWKNIGHCILGQVYQVSQGSVDSTEPLITCRSVYPVNKDPKSKFK